MGIFNRSIPTYTVDTANKLRVTTPLPEEEPNTYIDDAFDPILNQAVRNRLLKQWGNPISATLAGYYEMLDNAFVGSSKQWGALGPGMGVLGTFGRTMDKGGDAIIGTLTEGVKGLTGQGVESPFHNIFVKDEDYTGGKLLAAMGNSMAKMAGAPELTEEDFGGMWKIPSIGLELATDPGIMGGTMAKAGGAVGKLSTSEVLQNLGKSGRSPLADVGQLLSNYDDAMSKIALDVTAPGTRQAIKKFRNHLNQVFQHSSFENYVNRIFKAKTPEEAREIYREMRADPKVQKRLEMETAIAKAEDAKAAEDEVKEELADLATAQPPEPTPPVKKKRFEVRDFEPSDKQTKSAMRSAFEGYVDDIRIVNEEFKSLARSKAVFDKATSSGVDLSTKSTPTPVKKVPKLHTTPTKRFLNVKYKDLVPEDKLDYLVNHTDYFSKGTKSEIVEKQKWFKEEVYNLSTELHKKYPLKKLEKPVPKDVDAMTDPELTDEVRRINAVLTSPSKEHKQAIIDNRLVTNVNESTAIHGHPTDKLFEYYAAHGDDRAAKTIQTWYNMDEETFLENFKKHQEHWAKVTGFRKEFRRALDDYRQRYGVSISEASETLNRFPSVESAYVGDERNAVADALDLLIRKPETISNDEYRIAEYVDVDYLKTLRDLLRNNNITDEMLEDDASLITESVLEDVEKLSTVDGFMEWLGMTIPNTGAVDTVKRVVEPYTKSFSNAAITVSPSTIYNVRDIAILRNATAELETTLKRIMQDYGYFGEVTEQGGFWDRINNDPVIQNIFTPSWRVEKYMSDLETMFKQLGLRMPLDKARLRTNFFEEISKYPKLKEALGVKNAFVTDLSEVLFGDSGSKSVYKVSVRSPKKKAKRSSNYTVQKQFLALDRFTKAIIDTVDARALKAVGWSDKFVDAVAQTRGLNAAAHADRWFTRSVYDRFAIDIPMPSYEDALITVQNAAINYLNGDFYTELYKFAQNAQKNIFEPVKFHMAPKDVRVAASDSSELAGLTNFDYTRALNAEIRKHPDAFQSIGDIVDFAMGSEIPLNEFVEVKAKNIGRLRMEGSILPDILKVYSMNWRDSDFVKEGLYPVRVYLEKAGDDAADLARRKKVLSVLAKAKPTDTVESLLKDYGGVDKDVLELFTKYDLRPNYVKDITYNYHKSVGNKIIAENKAIAELNLKKPKELIEEPVVTYEEATQKDLYERTGVAELADDVKQMSGGKGFGGLTPEQVELLRNSYGDEAVDLFSLIDKATVANYNAKFTKTNTYDTIYGRSIAEKSSKLMESKTASDDLRMYDMIQTLEHGDSLSYAALMDELVMSGGHVGMRVGGERLDTLRTSLTDFVNTVNAQLGTNVLKLHEVTGKNGTYLGVVFDVKNSKKILKSKFKTLKFADDSVVMFEAPAALPASLRKFKESEVYAANDEFVREMSNYVQGIHSRLGFNYESVPHVKHVLSDLDAKHAPLLAEFYQGLDLDGLKELSSRLLNSDSFNHLYGTFGAVPFGRSLRGGNWRYNFDDYNTFDFTPDRVLSSSLSEGVLSNTNVQSFVGLFVNDNFKLNQYFKTVEELEDVLYARLESGKMSGNLDNLDIIAPVYNESGKVLRFQRFDKTSRSSLEKALKTEDAIIVPSHIVAPLDAWCKKDAKMSNRIYRFFNRMFALPYKIGVLANPGFLLGNVNDAYLKQATTLSEKYGTSVTEELVRVAESIRDVQHLNNSAAKAYDKILQFFDKEKITVLSSERPMMSMNINPKARKRVVDFLNGKAIVKGKEVDIEQFLRPEEVDSMRLWLYINSNQPTVFSKNGFRDLSKEDIQISSDDGFLSRIFYGSRHFNPNKPSTWGVFKNPATEGIFQVSESSETLFRSANVLNALKHEGYDAAGLAKILGEGYDEAAAKKLHVDTVNAMNVMYNSNFNYEAQSELMDKIGYAVPFPTFFVKNFAYWMELLVDNPEFIDSAITIQEGLWSDRDEEVSEDRFMAEAKGRGAVPISDGDDEGLSKFFKGIYKQTPLNSMFSAFNLFNHPIENLTNRVHPLISTPMQLAQAEMGVNNVGLATPEDAEDVKYRPYSFNQFERNVKYPDEKFNSLNFLFHKLNPYDRTIGNTMRLPHKIYNRDVQLSDIAPSVFQPDF